MKGYYLFAPVEVNCVGPESGVERKVRAQHKALQHYLDCELVILPPVQYSGSLVEKLRRRLPFTAAWRRWKYRGEFDDADFLYIRQVYHDFSFYRYLKKIRRRNPGIKIIYEVPTYPFERSRRSTKRLPDPFVLKRRKNLRRIFGQMDRVVTYYGQETIYDVPCICLINGLDFSTITLPVRKPSDQIHILSVSATGYWHGYDRLIKGLHNYYSAGGKEDVVYHLVGDAMPSYRKMVSEYGLSEHVILHGRLSGEPLREIYQKCLLGVDVLGGHRKNYPISSSLKSREYGAYGLPILTASPIDYLDRGSEYQCLLPYDDSPIDIDAVAGYYHHMYDGKDCNEVAKAIRTAAREKCEMVHTMLPLIQWLQKGME